MTPRPARRATVALTPACLRLVLSPLLSSPLFSCELRLLPLFSRLVSATIASADKGAWKSSYQAFADGTDDIGKVRKLSRKKSHSQANAHAARSELSLFGSGRHHLSERVNSQLDSAKSDHMPGYTGHIPKQADIRSAGSRNPVQDKTLLAENYRHNVVGYTGHVK